MVSSISRSIPSATPPRPPPPHYQTYLTPILHRRFARACLVGVAVSFAGAFIITDKSNFFWAIFPFGWTGFKAILLFFLSILPVLILRVSQLHVGARSYVTVFHAAKAYLGSFGTYSTLLTHSFASWVFVLLYLWSGGRDDRLGLIIEGKSYERPRLNERFLYLMFFGFYAGFVQGVLHLAEDRGRLQLPRVTLPPKVAFRKQSPEVASSAVHMALVSSCTGPFVYLLFRSVIWRYTLVIARAFYWLNRSSTLPAYPVGAEMFIRSLWIAFLVGCMWQVANLAFNIYFTQDPLSLDGKTVSEKSPDPNGTLLTGLKSSQAPLTQMLAFWELNHIAQSLPARRKAIFLDVDRKPANTFEQLKKECLNVLGEVDSKLSTSGKTQSPPVETKPTPSSATPPSAVSPPLIPVRHDNVLQLSSPSPSRKFIEGVQSKDGSSPSLQHVMQKLPYQPPSIAQAEATVTGTFKSRMEPFLSSPWGKLFRQSVQAATSQLIPNVRLQADAVNALARLMTSSLTEDEFGIAQKHVPTTLRAFSKTIEALEKYIAAPPIHWTDIESRRKHEEGALELPEPPMLLKTLNAAVKDIAIAFSPYVDDMALDSDVRAIVLAARDGELVQQKAN